ncbi:MAG: DUF6776 family protein [Porticoccaceae bacterium]
MKDVGRKIVPSLLGALVLAGLYQLGTLTVQQSPSVAELAPVDPEIAMQLARAELDAVVAEQALELLREDMVALRAQLRSVNEELALYRQTLGIEALPGGLSVGEMGLWPIGTDGNARRFGYRWVLMQNNKQRESLLVKARLWLSGTGEGQPIELSFDALGDSRESSVRVRYFTIVRGEIELPEEFDPQQLHVELRYSWMKNPQYQAQFAWSEIVQLPLSEPPSAISD